MMTKHHYRKGGRHRVAYILSALLLLVAVNQTDKVLAGCTEGCVSSAHGCNATTKDGIPFRFVGFGAAQADADIVCGPEDPNPQLDTATAVWEDFRFYADVPGVGIVKGSLNPGETSYLSFSAQTCEGLFPAEMWNNIFVTLSLDGMPDSLLSNQTVLQMYADNVASAPPDQSVISVQVNQEDCFSLVEVPGKPPAFCISGAEQRNLVSYGIKLHLVEPLTDSVLKLSVTNSFNEDITIAYFCHITNIDPALIQQLDGVISVDALAESYFDFDLYSISVGPENLIYVYAIVLSPLHIEGSDLLQLTPGRIPTLTEWGLMVLLAVLLGSGVWVVVRRRKAVKVRI